MKTLCWMHAHFGPDLAVHLILQFNPRVPRDQQYQLAHGYVLRDGQVHAVMQGRVVADRVGLQGGSMQVEVTGASGAAVSMRGGAIAGGAWPCYLCLHIYNTLHQWTTSEGRVGYGVAQDCWTMDGIAQRNLEALQAR